MKTLALIAIATLFTGCAKYRFYPIDDTTLNLIAEHDDVAIIRDSSLRRGNATTRGRYNSSTDAVNVLGAYQAGQANAATGGWADAVNKFAAKDTNIGGVEIIMTGSGAQAQARMAYVDAHKFDTSSQHDVDRTNVSTVSNSVQALEVEARLELIALQLKNAKQSLVDARRKADEQSARIDELLKPDPEPTEPEQPEFPGGNPNNLPLGGEDNLPGVFNDTLLWKPSSKRLLLPYPIRAKAVEVNGQKAHPHTISNGWRETYNVEFPVESPAEIVAEGHDGKTYVVTIENSSERYERKGMD